MNDEIIDIDLLQKALQRWLQFVFLTSKFSLNHNVASNRQNDAMEVCEWVSQYGKADAVKGGQLQIVLWRCGKKDTN